MKSFKFILAYPVVFQNMPYLIKWFQNEPISFLPYRVALSPTLVTSKDEIIVCFF